MRCERGSNVFSPCEACEGGIVTTHDPKDPAGVDTFTRCDECGGSGREYSPEWPTPFFIVLLIPNFLLFWS